MNTDELKAKAGELGIELDGTETDEQIQSLIESQSSDTTDDLSDDEIASMADQIKKKMEEKKGEVITMTKEELDARDNALIKRLEKKFAQKQDADDEEYIDLLDPTAHKREFVRLGRLRDDKGEYKFVVGLKDINNDPYVDQKITVQNIENPQKKGEMIPWSEFVFEDGTSKLYPYLAFMNRTNGVWAEVIERKEKDVSEKFGSVEVKIVSEENEWDMKNTGKRVLAKASKVETTFVCKDIKTGKILEVAEDVVNKADAPYADLKKYLADNK